MDIGRERRPLEALRLLLAAPVQDGGHGQEHEQPDRVQRGAHEGEEETPADAVEEEERL